MVKDVSDATLIQEYLGGKDTAFEKLYRKYERPLYAFVYRFVGSRESAEDLFQQTWLKVIRGLENYDERGKFGSWLFGIANHCCIDQVRQKSSESSFPGKLFALEDKQLQLLEICLKKMPEGSR